MRSLRLSPHGPIFVVGLVLYLAMLAVAMFWLNLPPFQLTALTVGGIGMLAMTLNPLLALHVFIMLLSIEGVVRTEEGVTGMKIVGALILGGWLLNVAAQRRIPLRFDGYVAALVVFVIWCGITTIYAFDPDEAFGRLFTYVQLALACVMFSTVVREVRHLRGILWSIVFWTTLSTAVAIAGYYTGATQVAVGLTGNRNLLAVYINIGIVCACLLFQTTRGPLVRLTLVASLAFLLLGLALTFSRAGLITVCIALLFVWYRAARQRGFVLLTVSAALVCLIVFLLPETFYKRVESIAPAIRHQEDTFGKRVRLWEVGLRMIKDNPIGGVGPGNFVPAFPRYARGEMLRSRVVAHNTFIGVGAETGIVGLILFLAILALAQRSAARGAARGRSLRSREMETLAIAVEVSLLVIVISGLAMDCERLKVLWMFFGLAGALGQMEMRAHKVRAESAPLSLSAASG